MQSITEVQTPTDSDVSQCVAQETTAWRVWNAAHEDLLKPTAAPDAKQLETEVKRAKEIINVWFAEFGEGIRFTVIGPDPTGLAESPQWGETLEARQAEWLSIVGATGEYPVSESLPTEAGVITLSDVDFDRLLAMLEEDREPSPALLRAGKRYKELVGW